MTTSAGTWGFGALFNAIKDAVIVADAATGQIVLWNHAAEAMLHYTGQEAAGLLLEDLVPLAFKDAHRKGLAAYAELRTGALIDAQTPVEVPAVRKDGCELLIELTLSRIANPRDPDGAYAMGMMRDVTKQRESEQTLRLMLDASAQAMFALDRFGRCTIANPAAAELLGCEPADVQGKNMHALMHHSRADGSPLPVADCQIHKTFTAGIAAHVDDEVFWRLDGRPFPAEYKSDPVMLGAMLLGAVVTFSDISDRKRAEAKHLAQQLQLRHRAETDVLTGIGNRRYANELLAGLRQGDTVVLIDVDRFKAINDEHGHHAGDEVLVSLATHLTSHLRAGDSVARIGGEEFLVVLRNSEADALAISERMATSWVAPVADTTFTAGIATHRAGTPGTDTLKCADSAMYEGKRAGRGRVVAYQPPDAPTGTSRPMPA
jgi:diguanylate cyclase (GGDEF)-like protein/PAS domain S-box-containing protein